MARILFLTFLLSLTSCEDKTPQPASSEIPTSETQTQETPSTDTSSTNTTTSDTTAPGDTNTPSSQPTDLFAPPSDCISNSNPEFTTAIMDPNNLTVVIPPGLMTESEPKGHSYMTTQVPSIQSPIFAPIDMTLTSILYYDSRVSDGQGDTLKIYLLEFSISCEVSIWLDHVYNPVEIILTKGGSTPAQSTGLEFSVAADIDFKAGDLIGYPQPDPGDLSVAQLDFGLKNTDKINSFLRSDTFNTPKFKNSDCPYVYFSDAIQSQYEALYGDSVPVLGGTCRSPAVDIAGTLSGYWFESEAYMEPGFEGLISVGLKVDTEFVQVGGLQSSSFFTELNGKEKPGNVTPGESVCYSSAGKGDHIFFKMVDATTISVAYHSNEITCPESFPDSSTGYDLYKTYYR
jgi:hypothetical protein